MRCLFTHAPSTTWIPDILHTPPKLNAYTSSHTCVSIIQVVGEHYSTFTSEDLSLSIGFESDKISLDVPEDGAQLKDDWKIYPRYDPAVSIVLRMLYYTSGRGKIVPRNLI